MVFETHTRFMFSPPKEGKPLQYILESRLINITTLGEKNLDRIVLLSYENGETEEATIAENKFAELIYTDKSVYEALGKEACIAFDIALSSGGCEAIVEDFYSLVGHLKKSGKQLNKTLTELAIVDWCLPLPIACPNTMTEITKLYIEGDKNVGLKNHRHTRFFDSKQRATYKVGKVIDRAQR